MNNRKEKMLGFLFAGIPVLGFLIFGIIPIFMAFGMSFMDIRGFSFEDAAWTGFSNYSSLLFGEYAGRFWLSLLNSLIELLALPISLAIALVLSVFLHKKLRGSKFYRVVLFIPYVCSVVAVTTMWKWIYEEEFGILNQMLMGMGLEKVGWISDSRFVRWSMLLTCVWSGISLGVILFSAALNNVSESYYEAAQIDGASSIKQFFTITVPAVSPTTFFLVVTGTIGYMQDFVRYQIMLGNSGGPSDSGLTMVFFLWQMAYRYNTQMGMGYACAMAILIALIIGVATLINYLSAKRWVNYDF